MHPNSISFRAFSVISAKKLLNLLQYGDLVCQFFVATVGELGFLQLTGVVHTVDIL